MNAAGHLHPRSHGHSHGLVHHSAKRSREGVRAVLLALLILGATAPAQVAVFVASAAVVALGLQVADPLIGLAITAVILRITWTSYRTVRGHHHA